MEKKMKAKATFSWKSDFQPPDTTNTVITCNCGWCCAFSCIVWYAYKTTGRLNRDVNVGTGAADDRESIKSAEGSEARHWGSFCCSISRTQRRRREVMERMRAARGQQRRLTGRQKEVVETSQLSGFSVKVAALRGNQVLMRRQHTTGSDCFPQSMFSHNHQSLSVGPVITPQTCQLGRWWTSGDVIRMLSSAWLMTGSARRAEVKGGLVEAPQLMGSDEGEGALVRWWQ